MKKTKKTKPAFTEQKTRTFGGVLTGLFGLLTISTLAGALIASTTFPLIAITSATSNTAIGFFNDLPSELELGELMEKTNIYATQTNGETTLLASFYDQNRVEVPYDKINDYVKKAAVDTEDPRFYEHAGIDMQGTLRAVIKTYLGDNLQGGSSITQQYVKNVLIQKAEALTDEEARKEAYDEATATSPNRKIKEIKYATTLEKTYTKDQILHGYLNIIGFGSRIYGIESAANYYFNTTAENLNLQQAATLIAIINNPNSLRIDQPENETNGATDGYAETLERRNYVLDQMLKHKSITTEEYNTAINTPIEPIITPQSTGCETAGGSGFFCDYVTWIVKNNPVFGETEAERNETLRRGGLQIYTTLDLNLQVASENAINAYIPQVMDGVNIGSTSVSVQPGTGRILAMAQNKSYSSNPDTLAQGPAWTSVNYNTDYEYGGSSGFQPGSTYKVFTLLEWLNTGRSLDQPVNGKLNYNHFTNTCEGDWYGNLTIRNDEGGNGGYTTARRSTINSTNTGFMSMAEQLDLCSIKNMAEKFGVHRADGNPLQSNPTSVLGTNEVSGLSMATAFAGIANNGVTCTPIAIDKITDINGNELPKPETTCTQSVDPGVANQAAQALQQVMTSGTGTSSSGKINDGVPLIGKTGTTDDAIHTWMIGSSKNVATAVWVGNVEGYASMRGTYIAGNQAATIRHMIWPDVMRVANSIYGGGGF